MSARPDWVERGRRLAEARIAKGLKQEDVVAKTGIDRATISKLENGRGSITKDKATKFAAVLDLDADDLISVASPSLLATLRELESLVRARLPEQQAEAAPDLAAKRTNGDG